MSEEENQPILKLSPRKKPLQKITVKKMPQALFDKLKERASRFNKNVPVYCRIVLEHSLKHQSDYTGAFSPVKEEPVHPDEVNIPILDQDFLVALKSWNPFGDDSKNKIALSLLKKHLDVRKW